MTALFIKSLDDLKHLYGAFHSLTKEEFMELGFTETEWHDHYRRNPLEYVCFDSSRARGSI